MSTRCFLSILGLFADVDVDEDGVWDSQDDCLDATACNYLASPTEPCGYLDALGECGGACEGDGDGDGICDDVDYCVGVVDECGVCNGPGSLEVVIDSIFIQFDSIYVDQIDDWLVFEVGIDTVFSVICPEFECGNLVSYRGYDYSTVLIGEQCWFAENLRSENYENGDTIPSGLSDSEWENTSSGAFAVYGEDQGCYNWSPDINACNPLESLEEYGLLYNWYAVEDSRGLCPSGWHVPMDSEWMLTINELGGLGSEAGAGGQMKTTYGWENGNNGTNSSGFSGLPAGLRLTNGFFNGSGVNGAWWSSSSNGSNEWYHYRLTTGEGVFRYTDILPISGFSVRCIKDSE